MNLDKVKQQSPMQAHGALFWCLGFASSRAAKRLGLKARAKRQARRTRHGLHTGHACAGSTLVGALAWIFFAACVYAAFFADALAAALFRQSVAVGWNWFGRTLAVSFSKNFVAHGGPCYLVDENKPCILIDEYAQSMATNAAAGFLRRFCRVVVQSWRHVCTLWASLWHGGRCGTLAALPVL